MYTLPFRAFGVEILRGWAIWFHQVLAHVHVPRKTKLNKCSETGCVPDVVRIGMALRTYVEPGAVLFQATPKL